MSNLINLKGRVYGRLTVLGLSPIKPDRYHRWNCRCTCGTRTVVMGKSLRSGATKSCGCLQKEVVSKANTTHGHFVGNKPTPEYNSWHAMLQRCTNEAATSYDNYGGRGITVCRRWRGKKGFENFLADMGPRPRGTTLDRIKVNGNYTPANCRWATTKEQALNTRRQRAR